MSDAQELGEAIDAFRNASSALRELHAETEHVVQRAARFEAAGGGLEEAAQSLQGVVGGTEAVQAALRELTESLTLATEALRRADPAGVMREVSRVGEQVERLRTRVDETGVETRSRLDHAVETQQTRMRGVEEKLVIEVRTSGEAVLKRLRIAHFMMAGALLLLATVLVILLWGRIG